MEFSLVTNDTPTATQSSSNDNTPDWDKINAERDEIELAAVKLMETQNGSEIILGQVCGYLDLGIQERGEYEEVYNPTDPKHIEKLEKGSFVEDRYNGKEKKKVPTICTPATPAKAYTLVVDFPDYMQDFGGDIGLKPFRMYMGGEFWVKNPDSAEGKKMKIIQRPFYMVENTNNPANKWALGTTTIPAKMGVAAGLADADGLFTKDQIVGLLGKTFQFEVRVWMKPDKNDQSKTYFTESIKYVGKPSKGQTVFSEDDPCFGVNFSSKNNPDWVKQLRASAKNTMKLALNWEGSVLQSEIEGSKASSNQSSPVDNTSVIKGAVKTPEKVVEPTKVNVEPENTGGIDEGWSDDIPFNPMWKQYPRLMLCM